MPERVTLEEIARVAGVATITVSRVLNGQAQYRRPAFARRAARIRRIADELGYRPNCAAQAMRSGRHGAVALLLSTVRYRSLLHPPLLDGILAALTPRGLHLTLSPVPDERLSDPDYTPKMLRTWACDGLLVNYNAEIPARLEEMVAKAAMPTVWINSKHEANCVYPDDFGAARALTERLLAAGHRRIAYANYMAPNRVPAMHYSAVERHEGYAAAMRAAGLAPRRLDRDRVLERDERVSHSLDWLRAPDAPTAVLCYCARTAASIAHAVHLAGVRPSPTLFAFGDEPPYAESYEWHTVRIPMHAMGERATELLLELIETPERTHPPLSLPCLLPPDEAFRPLASKRERKTQDA
jgi:LacI family transcriptional regulator